MLHNLATNVDKVVPLNGTTSLTPWPTISCNTGWGGETDKDKENTPSRGFSYEESFPRLTSESGQTTKFSRFALGTKRPASQPALGNHRQYPVSRRKALLQDLNRENTKKNRKRVSGGYEALLAYECTSSGASNEAIRSLHERYRKISNGTSIELALRLLKEESSRCRAEWILKGGSSTHAQFSFVGRALPVGSVQQSKDALLQHSVDLSSEFTTDGRILSAARVFSRRWAMRNCLGSHRLAAPDIPTLSGSTESTVRGGGLRGFATSLGLHPDAVALWDDPCLKAEITPQEIHNIVGDANILFHGRDLCRDLGQYPKSHVICLRERGLKTRVITKSPAALHFVGHVARKRLLGGLRKDHSSSSPLLGVDDTELINRFVGARAEVCVSTDLTRASDLLPLDLVKSIVEGLIDSGRFTNVECEVMRLLVGPQLLTYDDGLNIAPFVSKRGILMGLPITWAILSLVHLFWWDYAIRITCEVTRSNLSESFRNNRFSICGDDALFIGTRAVADAYKDIVSACGGSTSPGKHFECSPLEIRGSTKLRGVFLERLYQFNLESGTVVSGEREEAIPLRSFVDVDTPQELKEFGSSLRLSKNLKILYAFDSVWRQHPGGKLRLASLADSLFPYVRSFAKNLGLVNGLPLRFGGSGVPTRDPVGKAALLHLARAKLSEEAGNSLPTLLKGEVSSLWKMCTDLATFDIDQYFSEGINIQLNFSDPPPPPVDGAEYVRVAPREVLMRFAIATSYANNLFALGDSITRPRLSDKSVLRSVRQWRRGLPVLPDDPVIVASVLSTEYHQPIVWVRRTRGPSNNLLYPPWVSESFASEADRKSVV